MSETNSCCFHGCGKPGTLLIDDVWVCAGHNGYWEGLQRVREEQEKMDDAIAYLDPNWDREG